ncbi:kinase-like domain-containing protein [Melampsora americana]|nr:kinase-like domain-containing protein [Melampsora americana]
MVQLSIETLSHLLQDSISTLKTCFCQPDATLKLNGRTFKIIKLLGEGGFSYVYLTEDLSSKRLFALKKIRCTLGNESVREALKEVEAYKRFRHPNIIRCLDSCVIQDKDGDGKIVYLFLPYYSRGNLQDLITISSDTSSPIPEREILGYFIGTLKAVRAMHRYTPHKKSTSNQNPSDRSTSDSSSYPPSRSTKSLETVVFSPSMTISPSISSTPLQNETEQAEELEEEEEEEEQMGKTEEEQQEAPLMGKASSHLTLTDQVDSNGTESHQISTKANEIEAWAHRDLKPANVMISDEGQPILMDFGSALKARVEIPNRSIALQQQDLAAEHSSMPYRAPELFDVKTGETLTEAVDIWSLGCILYCLAYGHSPFETNDTIEQGGSMALAVMNGSWKFPTKDQTGYSDGLKALVQEMLVLDPKQRPTIDQVLKTSQSLLQSLSS